MVLIFDRLVLMMMMLRCLGVRCLGCVGVDVVVMWECFDYEDGLMKGCVINVEMGIISWVMIL